jgi:hypothetical protein
VGRGNNKESPDGIVDRKDWQGHHHSLARYSYEAEGALVLGMIHGSGMTVHRHDEGEQAEAAQQPDDGQTT